MKCCKDECYGTKTEILAVKTQGETGSVRELGINPRNDVPFYALAKRFSQGAMLFYHDTNHALGGVQSHSSALRSLYSYLNSH